MRHYPPKEPRNPAGHWSKDRDRGTQARFRKHLIEQAGGTYCQRCGARDVEVQAHHDTPTTGRLLCRPCHKQEDPHAR